MSKRQIKRISKLMSLILRHNPETIGVKLDENGWLSIQELIHGINRKGNGITIDLDLLEHIVETSDKQRFVFDKEHKHIRANQGHSVSIDLELEPMIPPEELFHGTVDRFLDDIRSGGLNKMSRQYVHLSQDLETAAKVGQRRGKPVILKIRSGDMCPEAYTFYKSNNGIWLTNHVPAAYIKFP
mmetsp:Transcript_13023/g.28740  ORF Transcript_13023/g.28740 Transcript_13023/m.28740 type:complete len:184 (-) Transcript_13023:307-858(-)